MYYTDPVRVSLTNEQNVMLVAANQRVINLSNKIIDVNYTVAPMIIVRTVREVFSNHAPFRWLTNARLWGDMQGSAYTIFSN